MAMLLVPRQGWCMLLLLPLLFAIYANGLIQDMTDEEYFLKVTDHSDANWFSQKLDHFDPVTLKWKQRYFLDKSHYKPGGPVFLILGGETSSIDLWISNTAWRVYAKEMGALCVLLEHRYYGKSRPTDNLSTFNLQYLKTRQALEDAVLFQDFLKNKLELNTNKWVVFGHSYSGILAAWLRAEYPDIFHAAVVYSAPIYLKANFIEFLEVVSEALLEYGGNECVQSVKNATRVLLSKFASGETFAEDLSYCQDLNLKSKEDVSFVMDILLTSLLNLVQNNRDRPSGDIPRDFNRVNLDLFCKIMISRNFGAPHKKFIEFIKMDYHYRQKQCISANYDMFLHTVKNAKWSGIAARGMRQWLYQSCTELGLFATTESKEQPFVGIPLSYYTKTCEKLFGYDVNSLLQSVEATNSFHEGLKVNATKIVFANGSLDPWQAVGINYKIKEDVISVRVKGASHSELMIEESKKDTKELKIARKRIGRLLVKWLQ